MSSPHPTKIHAALVSRGDCAFSSKTCLLQVFSYFENRIIRNLYYKINLYILREEERVWCWLRT